MRLPLVILPKYRKYLFIENKYKSEDLIIPIGCDCHPAYTLTKLNIRKHSLPFDWLNTDSLLGLKYVKDNIDNNFENFISNLELNEKGNVVSKFYRFAEFLHEKDLIENNASQLKFRRRIDKFIALYTVKNCHFLYNIRSESLTSIESVNSFIQTVNEFVKTIKDLDKLSIYIRYDENYKENEENCDILYNCLKSIKKVSVTKYIRHFKKNGVWGDPALYTDLYDKLGISIKWDLLTIYTKDFRIK